MKTVTWQNTACFGQVESARGGYQNEGRCTAAYASTCLHGVTGRAGDNL